MNKQELYKLYEKEESIKNQLELEFKNNNNPTERKTLLERELIKLQYEKRKIL